MNKPKNKQQVTRREWLNLSMMCSALLLSNRANAAPRKPAFPIFVEAQDGSAWTPDHYTYEDVRDIVFAMNGYGSCTHEDSDVLDIMWRFRSLSDAEAVDWLTRLSAELEEEAVRCGAAIEDDAGPDFDIIYLKK